MIPHPAAGVQPWGYPPRAVSSGTGHADASQSGGQFVPRLPPQPQSRPPAAHDLATRDPEPHQRGPPAKRLRLDVPAGSFVRDASPAYAAVGEPKDTSGSADLQPSSAPWRTGPVWSFQGLVSDAPAPDFHGENAVAVRQSDEPASLPPLPSLPWKHAPPDTVKGSSGRSRENSPAKDVPTTPYRIQVPDAAPVLKDNKIGDFAPWTGNHPEDVLNEQTAKQGHYDRTQVSQNESSTARQALYGQLRHRSGLQLLSSVFAAALEKRQDHNVVDTPSTFKPPPRVTLTDNKRETWLRDLANPSVQLRRLSRTIPHGIRGKILLEQCLSKSIPVGRAVWLAKCVGANEIRAFKRKGTSGALAVGLEVKWVREWTTNVQQFMEGVVSACGVPDWRAKMRYAVGLTARLFYENLLDHDLYLEWFLSSLEAASISALPIWLLMLGIYWDHALRYRKRGRRLAEVLLGKLREVTMSEQAESLQQLDVRLSCFIRRLARDHTSSMVLSNSWNRYKDLVPSCLNLKDSVDKAILHSLVERNVRVYRPQGWQQTAQPTPRQRIIRLLDVKQRALDIPSVSATCLDAVEDRRALVSSVLEWSATPFRSGLYRVYVSVRLLRKWKRCGIDVDSHILSFLTEARGRATLNMDNVYHAVSELVRSQTFSVGRYLQWLMAKGLADSSQLDQQKGMSADIGLLAQLPTNRLPEHVCNLRNTLFSRLGFSASQETSTIAAAKANISRRLPKVFEFRADGVMPRDLSPSDLTWAMRAEIGQWVRRGVAEHYLNSTRTITGVVPNDPGISALTPEDFYTVRDILESFEDLSMLADVLKNAANCDDSTVLASAADTINYHLDSFSVIGATTDLFRRISEAYLRLKRQGVASLDLLFSLMELGLQIPSELNTVILLRQDFARMENKSALAISSPVSDHVPEIFSEADPSLCAKLDQILSPGSGIDESTWDTIFNVLMKALEFGPGQAKLSRNDTCRYLAQSRRFYPKRFDGMLIRWVCGVLKSSPRPSLLIILPPLIGVGCVTIQAFMTLVTRLSRHDGGESAIPNMDMLKIDLVELLVAQPPEQGRYFDLVSYRFQLAQQEFLVKRPEEALNIVRDAATSLNGQEQEPGISSRKSDFAGAMMKLLRTLLTQSPDDFAKHCMQKLTCQQPAFVSALQKALDLLLDFNSCSDRSSRVTEAEKVIAMVNDFSLPFCQLKLQILFNAEAKGEIQNDIVDVMFKAAVADSGATRSHWVDLVALMSQDAVRQIRERAEKEFFSIPLLENVAADPSSTAARHPSSLEAAKSYLSIIEQLASSIPDAGVQSIAPILVEKMDLLLQKVIAMQTNLDNFTGNRREAGEQTMRFRANFERAVAFWFSALLRMVVVHRPAFSMPATAAKPSNVPEQSRLLVSIFCISLSLFPTHILRLFPTAGYFPQPVQSADSSRPSPGILMQTHALDVAASLIDTFPDEARHQCALFLKTKCPPFAKFQNDTRFAYLLGPIPDPPSSSIPPQPASLPSPAAPGSTPAPAPTPVPSSSSANLPPPSQQSSAPPSEGSSSSSTLRLQYRGRVIGAYPLRPWELLEDAAPVVGVNDTAVSLGYFDARRVK